MKEINYDKLVRDKIPNIIEMSGKICVSRIADDKEYRTKIFEKVQEELLEFESTPNVEEAADILEVVYALFDSYQLMPTEQQANFPRITQTQSFLAMPQKSLKEKHNVSCANSTPK